MTEFAIIAIATLAFFAVAGAIAAVFIGNVRHTPDDETIVDTINHDP